MSDHLRAEPAWDDPRHLLASGHLLPAVEVLRERLTRDGNDAEAHALLSLALTGLERLQAARHEAKIASALSPQAWPTFLAWGVLHARSGRLALAEEVLQQAVERSDRAFDALLALARLYLQQGRPDDAQALLSEVLARDPQFAPALIALGELHLARGAVAAAALRAHEALAEDPDAADAAVLQGRTRLQQGDLDGAIAGAARALDSAPGHGGGLRLLADAQARRQPWLGLWWRYNAWLTAQGAGRSILVMLLAFAAYRVASGLARQEGLDDWAGALRVLWLALVAFTWVGPVLFQRAVNKALGEAGR